MTDSAVRSFSAAKAEIEERVEPFEVEDLEGVTHSFVADFNVGTEPMLDWMESGMSDMVTVPAILRMMLGDEEYARYKALNLPFPVTLDLVIWLSNELGGGLGN